MRKRIAFFLLFISAILTGCALHAPISETLVFQKNIKSPENFSDLLRSTYSRGSVVKSIYGSSFLQKKKNEFPVLKDSSLNIFYQSGVVGYSLLFKLDHNLAFGINPSLLKNAGVDFTWNFYDEFYLTCGANLYENYEIICQRKIIDKRKTQASLGIVFKHEKMAFYEKFFSDDPLEFNVNMVGIRGVLLFPAFKMKPKGILSVSYDMQYKEPIVHLGFAFGM